MMVALQPRNENAGGIVAAAVWAACFFFFHVVSSVSSFSSVHVHVHVVPSRQVQGSQLFLSSSPPEAAIGKPSELPDSMEDGAQMAAQACADLIQAQGGALLGRCRIDFDTSAGDETFSLLKQSTDFMQQLVTKLCYLQLPDMQVQRQAEMMRVIQAKTKLEQLQAEYDEAAVVAQKNKMNNQDDSDDNTNTTMAVVDFTALQQQIDDLQGIVNRNGRDPNQEYTGPIARIYFPDEGNAALARRDWTPKVPPCVRFSSCGGVQSINDVSKDQLVFFFCPKASEATSVEEILRRTETGAAEALQLTVFVNPILVDMGVTGFGMAGRLLRERLIDPLPSAYYLRTLPWGALTRVWPRDFSVWQEDDGAGGGYRLIRSLPRLPSNPEVEDIYDIENGLMEEKKGGGLLDQFGDFVNGMMKL